MFIHQIWLGSDLPKHLEAMTETWKEHHPDAEHVLWNEEMIAELDLQNKSLFDNARRLVSPDAVYQYQADVARYEILHRYGGIYADTDTTCQRPTYELFETQNLVAGWEVQGKWIGNTVMYAPPEHRGLKAVIASLPRLARKGRNSASKLSGPQAITQTLRTRQDVTLLDQGIFYPVPYSEPERSTDEHPNAYVVHHWQHQRDVRNIPW